ncbi:nuclear transport factor 2 family protein [Ancylobacter vacuolatus]|uniref:Ketosteroid isomerase-like protein n=1 Tax=Ancylobacter vacuolatus TaxID=223389 RepID=A0ABU0DN43_9HYPH|nr:nuclear transport factor 2 family protein [Ancylobacter vacuolatus]MDQ0349868.1 ketosteroid isomerase-like protein [Ancylobacter vacuolatus]
MSGGAVQDDPTEADLHSVAAAERLLCAAALAGDVAALDALLADDLVFVNQFGHVLSKQDDLDLHRTGAFALETLAFSDYRLSSIAPGVVRAVLRADASGTAGGAPFEAKLRFTRIWRREPAGWRVASIHSSVIA